MSTNLVKEYVDVGVVKFGNFKLKNGGTSFIYFDFRILVSYPRLLEKTSDALFNKVRDNNVEFNSICGVPYTSLPIATCSSIKYNIPMILRRKEVKEHGTGNILEGLYNEVTVCLVYEDVVTSGSSIIDTVKILRAHNIKTFDTVAILNREQGSSEALAKENIRFHYLFTIQDFIDISLSLNKIPDTVKLLLPTLPDKTANLKITTKHKRLAIRERARHVTHPFSKKLFEIILSKRTNLCVAIDLTKYSDILNVVDQVGEHVCVVKIHVDIIEDFCQDFIVKLKELSEKYNFLIFEDRKYSDIGNTVSDQFHSGIYHVSNFADLVNAHVISGPSVVDGLKKHPKDQEYKCHACLLVAEMSCAGNIMDYKSIETSNLIANAHPDFVVGFISQHLINQSGNFIQFTPGVSISQSSDKLGQQYNTPETAIENGADVIIVGRSIVSAQNPKIEAMLYQNVCYKAYMENEKND